MIDNFLANLRIGVVFYVLESVDEGILEIDVHVLAIRFVAAMSSANPVAPEINGFIFVRYWRINDFSFV